MTPEMLAEYQKFKEQEEKKKAYNREYMRKLRQEKKQEYNEYMKKRYHIKKQQLQQVQASKGLCDF